MAKFQGIKIRENAMVYILEIISLADFRHLGLLCATVAADLTYHLDSNSSPLYSTQGQKGF